MIALVAAVKAEAESDPGFAYHVGVPHMGYPYVYTHHVAQPVVYTAANVCKNEGGQLVPCAHGVVPGSSVYAHVGGFAGVVPVAAAPAAEAPAAEEDAVVDVSKREAEADPEADPESLFYGYYGGYYGHPYNYYGGYYGYYGHPYYAGVGCRNNYGALVPCAGK